VDTALEAVVVFAQEETLAVVKKAAVAVEAQSTPYTTTANTVSVVEERVALLAAVAVMAFLVAVDLSRGQTVKALQQDPEVVVEAVARCSLEAGKPEPLDTVA